MAKDTGIVNIHGKEYSTVAKRVQDFRTEHGLDKYAIVTELVERTSEDVVMRAVIQTLDGQVIATGYAEEKRSASQINRTSALENCETSAIGRALAAFGMAGSEYASADEVAQAISQQASPAPAVRKSTSDLATEAQLGLIAKLMGEKGINRADERLEYAENVVLRELASASELTKAEATQLIDELKGEK